LAFTVVPLARAAEQHSDGGLQQSMPVAQQSVLTLAARQHSEGGLQQSLLG
jgi:hypothetical protein